MESRIQEIQARVKEIDNIISSLTEERENLVKERKKLDGTADLPEYLVNGKAVKYIEAKFSAWPFEDACVNGQNEAFEHPRIPGADLSTGNWVIEVDVHTGKITGWPEGIKAETFYKSRDMNEFTLLDEDRNQIAWSEGYVPEIFDINGTSFGDYVELNINDKGFIEGWRCSQELINNMI